MLDGDGLTLTGLALDDWPLGPNAFEVTPNSLTIPVPPPRPLVLTISTRIDPSANTQLMGLYRSRGIYCTQCEAEGFRRITYFLDRPDVLAIYTTRIEAERTEAPVLLSNGNLIERGKLAGTSRHYAVWHDPFPKPCYLFALVGGNLAAVRDRFVTASGRTVDLAHLCRARQGGPLRLRHGLAQARHALGRGALRPRVRSRRVQHRRRVRLQHGGDGEQGPQHLQRQARPGLAGDRDRHRLRQHRGVIAHEYFHNWTGNRITCRDWFQLCLKEGLTVFRDQEFSADQRSRPVKRIVDVRLLQERTSSPRMPGRWRIRCGRTRYHEINNFYTATVYEKGAEVVRMLQTLLGPEGFRNGMDLYFERHDGQAATVEDFVTCFADASGGT